MLGRLRTLERSSAGRSGLGALGARPGRSGLSLALPAHGTVRRLRRGRGVGGARTGPADRQGSGMSQRPLRRRLLPELSGTASIDHIALAFDDGPHPRATPAILQTLQQYAVTATFFLVGQMVADHRDIAKRIAADGHEVAVHGFDHELLPYRGPRAVRDDIARTVDLIGEIT